MIRRNGMTVPLPGHLHAQRNKLEELADLGYTYRHSALPEGAVVVSATFRGESAEPAVIQAEMDRIAAARLDALRSAVAALAT